MAAEAMLSGLVEQLTSFILVEAKKEVWLLVEVKDEIEKLNHTFQTVNTFMEDADRKQMKNKLVKLWLEDLKNLAYDMEDVIEEWIFEIDFKNPQTQQEVDLIRRPMKEKVLSFFSLLCLCFKPLGLRYRVGHQIKHIRQRLDFIVEEKNKFQLAVITSTGTGGRVNEDEGLQFQRELTSSVIDVSVTFGRDSDKYFIKSKLMISESCQLASVPIIIIAVWGMGGLGKTTLAQMVYNDKQVRDCFEKTMWVCVSDPFDKVRLARSIIEETGGGQVPDGLQWNALHNRLSDAVKDKRFLLVLDDVWTEDPLQWEPLKISLNSGAQGSRILVTTRNEKVAVMMNATHTHRIGQLPEPDCWSLFSRIAFAGWSEEDKHKAEEMGRKIVNKCKGVPLSVKTLAGLLHNKKNEEDWQHVLESDLWKEDEVAKKILPALLLSYYDLPPKSKRCFAYCAVFPKDYPFEKDKLIMLWMAHGFLNSKGKKEPEKIGDDYFDDLVMRSFFQDVKKNEYGNIISCKMHDLVHDLAQFLARNECLSIEDKNAQINDGKTRHLTICKSTDTENFDLSAIYKAKKLRTLMINSFTCSDELFHHLRFLRVLDLSESDLKKLPSGIENLKHLRYLDLSRASVKELPETLCDLHHLQTLKLNSCDLCELPEGMGKMTSLRHLEMYDTSSLRYMPQGIGKLCNLRILNKFVVRYTTKGCKLEELKNLIFLRGNLEIRGLGRLPIAFEANEANLKGKEYLEFVKLNFSCEELEDVGQGDVQRMEDTLEGLQIHANVETFVVNGYLGSKFPTWMMSESMMSFKLRVLTLEKCEKCKLLPALGRLPYLERLYVSEMKEVKCIDRVFFGVDDNIVRISFPKLKKLSFRKMDSLVEWQWVADNVDTMPQLNELYLDMCPMLVALPPLGKLKSLKRLEIYSMDSVKCIGLEFFGIHPHDAHNYDRVYNRNSTTKVAFPQLDFFKLQFMYKLEEWEFPVGQDPCIFPCLRELIIAYCRELRTLPALGILKSLEKLEIDRMKSMKCIGLEFWGILNENDGNRVGSRKPILRTAFPRLTSLEIQWMDQLEEWELPIREDIDIMPCLRQLRMVSCPTMRALPPLGKLKSLEQLVISRLVSIEHIGLEFWGISDADWTRREADGEPFSIIAFPNLKRLEFEDLSRWEEWKLLENDEQNGGLGGTEDISITIPCLNHLLIRHCKRLKVIPRNISSCTPWKLEIFDCPGLQIANTQGMAKLQELNVDRKRICLV